MRADEGQSSLFRDPSSTVSPLAERCRPRTLDDFVGQESIVGPGSLLRRAVDSGELSQSMIFWGPPGCGKTTLARVIAGGVRNRYVPFSAVTSSIRDVRAVIADARKLRDADGLSLLLFVDEIHRFNRAQQDAFLPHIEDGTIVLIGATTENPGFEVIAPLLSRSRVCVFEPLTPAHLEKILRDAMQRAPERFRRIRVPDEVIEFMASQAGGDARVGLNALDYLGTALSGDGEIHSVTRDEAADALQRPAAVSDRAGDSHYNLISALHKSMRGGDADAALYWLARMCEAGEDPMYISRRLVRFASEDVGNADPMSLLIAVAARDAVEFTGYPECKVNLAQCVVWMALAPKSNAAWTSYENAARCVRDEPGYPVPAHLRNTPPPASARGDSHPPQGEPPPGGRKFLPEPLAGRTFCELRESGREDRLRRTLEETRSGPAAGRRPASSPKNG